MAKVNSHLQPQFYLKGFLARKEQANHADSVFVYKKGMGFITEGTRKEKNPSKEGIGNVASLDNFYAFETQNGTIDPHTYENKLSLSIENPANYILEKLRTIKLRKNQILNFGNVLTNNERKIFARYVAAMSARTKSSRQKHNNAVQQSSDKAEKVGYSYSTLTDQIDPAEKKRFDDNLKKFLPQFDKENTMLGMPPKLLQDFRDKAIKGESYPKGIFELVNFVEPYILSMKWQLRITPAMSKMFTGDEPVYWTDLSQPNAVLYFPIATNVIFCGYKHSGFSENIYLDKNYNFLLEIRELFARKCSQLYFCERAKWLVDFFNRN